MSKEFKDSNHIKFILFDSVLKILWGKKLEQIENSWLISSPVSFYPSRIFFLMGGTLSGGGSGRHGVRVFEAKPSEIR